MSAFFCKLRSQIPDEPKISGRERPLEIIQHVELLSSLVYGENNQAAQDFCVPVSRMPSLKRMPFITSPSNL